MAQKALICLILLLPLLVGAQTITIGNGEVLHQGLPLEPAARFSYSQQLFYAAEIDHSGSITHLGFNYHINSNVFYEANKHLSIYMGHSALNTLEDWVSIQSMVSVYDGVLSLDSFDAGLPGSGWLMIPLQTPFNYDNLYNLIIAVDENSDASGNTADDFFCRSVTGSRAIQCQSPTVNPDPLNPALPATQKEHLSNIRLVFSGSPDGPQNLHGSYVDGTVQLGWDASSAPNLAAYRILRNGSFLAESTTNSYSDSDVSPGNTYHYLVQIRYQDGSISGSSNSVSVAIPEEGTIYLISESFEACTAFSGNVPGWQNLDLDASLTWGWDTIDFPGEGDAMGWLVFVPNQCDPPLTEISAHSGTKMLMATASMTPPNNDWLISPYLHLGQNATLTFMARSLTAAYGLERLRVLISPASSNPDSFKALHSENFLAVPSSWTEYNFDLSQYADQDVWLALNCVSLDAFALFIDDLLLTSEGGHLDATDDLIPPPKVLSYPNPARKSFTLVADNFFAADIYNLKGQRLHRIKGVKRFDSSALTLPAGLYLIRVKDGDKSYTIKQVVLP
jgi:hypothetical protein